MTRGQPRKLTDAQLQRLLDWRPLNALCAELGICYNTAQTMRKRYRDIGVCYKTRHRADLANIGAMEIQQ